MNDFQTKRPDAELSYTFDFTDQVPAGVTVDSISHVIPTGMTAVTQATDPANKRSTLLLAGGTHGRTYMVVGRATLSNGEKAEMPLTVQVFNG